MLCLSRKYVPAYLESVICYGAVSKLTLGILIERSDSGKWGGTGDDETGAVEGWRHDSQNHNDVILVWSIMSDMPGNSLDDVKLRMYGDWEN